MLAAWFVIVFNFQTVLTQSRRAVAYFTSSHQASKRQAGQIQKVLCANVVLRGIINPSARASDGAGCGLINFREAASLAEPSSGRILAVRIGRPPPVSQIGSGLGE
jgi:hypothetical protein